MRQCSERYCTKLASGLYALASKSGKIKLRELCGACGLNMSSARRSLLMTDKSKREFWGTMARAHQVVLMPKADWKYYIAHAR